MSKDLMIPETLSDVIPLTNYVWLAESVSESLLKIHEPSLWHSASDSGFHAYRLQMNFGLYLKGPIVMRLNIHKNGGTASVRWWHRVEIGVDPEENFPIHEKRLAEEYTRQISPRQANKFLRTLDYAEFWHLSPVAHLGADGQTWEMEGVRRGKFHYVRRWMHPETAFRKIGLTLLDICGAKLFYSHVRTRFWIEKLSDFWSDLQTIKLK